MNRKTWFFLILSSLGVVIIFAVALMVGKYYIAPKNFFRAVFTKDNTFLIERTVIVKLRLPRTLMALLCGVSLSVSGLLYQEIFQNKLTSPNLLGVSSGAALGAAVAIILGLHSILVSTFAFALGIITVVVTILIARLFKNGSITLILSGVIVGGFMSALLSFVKYFADPTTTLTSITYWLMGSFENTTIETVYIMLPLVVITSVVLIVLSWHINIVALGEEEAQTKGLNYRAYKYSIITIATLLTSLAVAFSGTVSWVGLVVPHIVRLISGRDARKSIPLCITFGGIFMIVVDMISRSFTKAEIPLSAVTGVLGTIIFITILIVKRKEKSET